MIDKTKYQKQGRTSRFWIFCKMVGYTTFFIWLFFNIMPFDGNGVNQTVQNAFGISLIITPMIVLISWAIDAITYEVICGEDEEHKKRVKNGCSPFWDRLPEFLNPDSVATRYTGLAEPKYTNFVPPPDWMNQCPYCGARMKPFPCWNCNYGDEPEDIQHYYARFGHDDPDMFEVTRHKTERKPHKKRPKTPDIDID